MTPEGERTDPLLFGDFAKAYLDLLHGTTAVEVRAGAVLNKRNLGRVKAIMQHAQEILAEAEPLPEEEQAPTPTPAVISPPPEQRQEVPPIAPTEEPILELDAVPTLEPPAPVVPEPIEFTLEAPAPVPAPESPEVLIELEAVAPTEAAPPLPATPAPPSPSGQEDLVIEVDAEQLAAAVAQGIEQTLGGLTGDARSARGKRRK